MVNWLGVPECESNQAILWCVLAWFLPGIAQIVAGVSLGHSDSTYIGIAIILLLVFFPLVSFILITLISIVTFGFGAILFNVWPIVFIIPSIWSIVWGINCVVKNGNGVQQQNVVYQQPQQPQQPMQQQPMQQQQPMMQQPMQQQPQPQQQQQQQYVDQNGQLYVLAHPIVENGILSKKNPSPVAAPDGFTFVDAGTNFALFLRNDSTVWATGKGENIGIEYTGSVYEPVQIPSLFNITKISAGAYHSLALSGNGSFYTFGSNTHYQLGDGTNISKTVPVLIKHIENVIEVNGGRYHTLVLTENGTVFSFGYNSHGQLGLNLTNSTLHMEYPTMIPTFTNITKVSAGGYHSMILDNGGNVYVFGSSTYGQLGLDDQVEHISPVRNSFFENAVAISAGGFHSLVLDSGTSYGFGDNSIQQLGVEREVNLSPRSIFQKTKFIYASLNEMPVAAISNLDQALKNGFGYYFVELSNCTGIACGKSTCYFVKDSKIYSRGTNEFGEAGVPLIRMTHLKGIDKKITGEKHSLSLKNTSLFTVGESEYYQLGNQYKGDSGFPFAVQPFENISHIAAGEKFSMFVSENGSLYGSGYNGDGELGLGNPQSTNIFIPLNIPTKVLQLSVSNSFALVIANVSDFYSMGINTYGEIGSGSVGLQKSSLFIKSGVLKIAAGGFHSLILCEDSSVYSFGRNNKGQLGDGTTNNNATHIKLDVLNVTEISAGREFSILLVENNSIYVFGSNTFGQLGLGIINGSVLFPTLLENFVNVTKVACGHEHTVVLTSDHKVYLFGSNDQMQLGNDSLPYKNINPVLRDDTNHYLDIDASFYNSFLYFEFKCFGILESNNSVCSSNGACTGIDICTCLNGFSGDKCQFHSCFGINATNSIVCSSHGSCNSLNNCTCNNEYAGSQCEIYSCFGVNSTDLNVCSSNGNCVSSNVCNCEKNYTGNDCEFSTCFGLNSTDSNVCSSHGTCISVDNCTCSLGYFGIQCEFPSCFGINATNSSVCSSEGICSSLDNCTCNIGHQGSECQELIPPTSLYGSGKNFDSMLLGNGIATSHTSNPFDIPKGFISISAGDEFTLFLRNDSTVWIVGKGMNGMGMNLDYQIYKPVQIPTLSNILKIEAGNNFGFAIGYNSSLFVFGSNSFGTLGMSSISEVLTTAINPYLNNVSHVSGGIQHSLFISNGSLYSCGQNTYGQLGDGTFVQKPIPVFISSLSNVVQISAGNWHSLVLLDSGEVYSFGSHTGGVLGVGIITSSKNSPQLITTLSNITQISAGNAHSTVIDHIGDVYVFGSNTVGEIGLGMTLESKVPLLLSIRNISSISASQRNTWFIKNDRTVFVTGFGVNGQLGLGNYSTIYTPTQLNKFLNCTAATSTSTTSYILNDDEIFVSGLFSSNIQTTSLLGSYKKILTGEDHSLILDNNSTLHVLGNNFVHQLGISTTIDPQTTPKKVNESLKVKRIIAGSSYSLIVTEDGRTYGSGENTLGQLGIGSKTNSSIFTLIPLPPIDYISTGKSSSFALSNSKDCYVFGYNGEGELGIGSTTTTRTPSFRVSGISLVAMGQTHSFVMSNDSTVYASGSNNVGQLGIGFTSSRRVSPVIVNIQKIIQISAGDTHSLFLNSNYQVYVCGSNRMGQIGFSDVSTPKSSPTLLSTVHNVSKISCGFEHTLLLTNDFKVYAFGSNTAFQIGNSSLPDVNNYPILIDISKRYYDIDASYFNSFFFVDNIQCFGIWSTDSTVCSSNGVCASYDNCQCNNGYSGNQCEFTKCFGKNSTDFSVCSNNGTCISLDQCLCSKSFGNECQFPICFGIYSNETAVCSNNGTCAAPDNCVCSKGYSGSQCEVSSCNGVSVSNPNVCSGNGNCVSLDKCTCNTGFLGNDCQFFLQCYGKNSTDDVVCSGNGNCSSSDICICQNEYVGNQCQFKESLKCFGKNANDTGVCSGNGFCSSSNNCTCSIGYYGNECNFYNCNEKSMTDSTVCSSNGFCLSPNNCSCFAGYVGSDCESPTCFGFNSSNPSTCSSNGICSGVDRCMCKPKFSGEKCEKNETVEYSGDLNCAVFSNDYIRFYQFKKSMIIEPSICTTSGWAGVAFHKKQGIDTSMFLAVSWYSSGGSELKISELKNHREKSILKKSTVGLLFPDEESIPDVRFQNKQRFTIRVDDILIKNYDYISIVCGSKSPIQNNSTITFSYHESVNTRYFNISNTLSICDAFVLSGFSNRIADTSENLWFIEMGLVSKTGRKSLYFKFIMMLKFIASPRFSFFIISSFWILLTMVDFLVISALPPFMNCTTRKSFGIYFLHLVVNIVFGILLIIIGIIDIISNVIRYFVNIKKRKQYRRLAWLKLLKDEFFDFYFKGDPYFFRIEQIIAFFVFCLYVMYEVVNFNRLIFGEENLFHLYLGKYFSTIGRSVITYAFAFYQVLLPLIVAIFLISIKLIKGWFVTKIETDADELDYFLSKPEFFDLFLVFAQSEWSQENVLAFRDVKKYRQLKNEKRLNHAFDIYYMYLNGENAPLQINIDSKSCNDLMKIINDPKSKLSDTLFNGIEKGIKINLSDTWSRFILTNEFSNYQKNREIQLQEMKFL
eukprot:gene8338-162_t